MLDDHGEEEKWGNEKTKAYFELRFDFSAFWLAETAESWKENNEKNGFRLVLWLY